MARQPRTEFPGASDQVTCRMIGDRRVDRSGLFIADTAAGRLTNVTWQVGTAGSAVRYSDKPNSDLLEETVFNTANGLTVQRTYDALDRLTSITNLNNVGAARSEMELAACLSGRFSAVRPTPVVPSDLRP